jgi:AcrR family transcriptional regulator
MARRSDHTRDEIRDMALKAAAGILAAEGPAALSTRKVAGAIGYTVGTLYLVFRNLDDLILQVNAKTLDDLQARMIEETNRAAGGLQRVLAVGRTYLRFALERPHRWTLVYEHRLPAEEAVPEWYLEKVALVFQLLEGTLRPVIDARSEADLSTAARVIWSGVHGIAVLSVTHRLHVVGSVSAEALVDSLIVNYLKGLRAIDAAELP